MGTRVFRYLFSWEEGDPEYRIARWLFLRSLGLLYFSAFFSLLFQIRGLIGSHGLLPAAEYLEALRRFGALRYWYAPTLLWISGTDHLLVGLCWAGLIASVLLVANVLPRAMLLVCFVCFLSFTSAAQEFAGYQSDGMLLEAGFLSMFLPSRAARFLLLWEWFRIYFESGVVKLMSGDPTWHNLTAMYEYYQNGPLPTWIGWYLQHLPNWFHIGAAAVTLVMELGLVWMAFLPRPWRIACFFIVTVWQIGVIASANYAFLNYLVLILAFLLLDDRYLGRFAPAKITAAERTRSNTLRTAATAVALTWIAYAATVPMIQMFLRSAPFPATPVVALEPFRIANQYGLFAVMTPHRYEIEFQGSNDGQTWIAYPFRYKPQDVKERPRIYAPYQPRFDWNLWFASLGAWQQYPFVGRTEELLLQNDRDVLSLFAGNPFENAPPKMVRAVIWQYWFSSPEQKRREGVWWRRELLGQYAPTAR